MGLTLGVHVLAGLLGLLTGAVALAAVKGGLVHRRSGMAFVVTMLVMCATGLVVALARSAAPLINVPAALFTAYLVTTALMAIRPPSGSAGRATVAAMLVGLAICLTNLALGAWAIASPRVPNGFAFPLFLFGSVGLMASVGDVRLIRAKGFDRRARLRRHLWRMCFALTIAALSFFIGQADVFPRPIRFRPLLAMPPLAVLAVMTYWMRRTRLDLPPRAG
jgi:uncharacterized membrane protein